MPRGCEVLVAGLCALLALATTAGDDARQHAAVRPQRLAGTATATRRQPAGSQACERWVCHGAARLRGGAEEASASSSRGAAEEPVLAASLPSAETFDSDDSLVVAAGGARAVSNTEAEGARAGAVPLRPRPPGPKPARAPRQEGSSRASAPDSREPEGEQADGAPPRPRWKHPLPIPAGAEGFELWRWLQARNMGEEFYDVDGLGRADVAHEERSGPDGGSWIAKMEKTQTNVKEPTDDPYSMDALLGEDMTQYFPDGATEHLWWACEYGNAEAARAALEAGAQVNFTHARYHCRTPLHSAASLGEVDDEIVRMLIDAGADVNAEDEVGCRPLHMAAVVQLSAVARLRGGASDDAAEHEGAAIAGDSESTRSPTPNSDASMREEAEDTGPLSAEQLAQLSALPLPELIPLCEPASVPHPAPRPHALPLDPRQCSSLLRHRSSRMCMHTRARMRSSVSVGRLTSKGWLAIARRRLTAPSVCAQARPAA